MKIIRYQKQKCGMYLLQTESGTFSLHEDLILKHELLLRKEISEEERRALEKENQEYQAYDICLQELGKKLRTKRELREFLTKKGYLSSQIDSVIQKLQMQGYLDETIYRNSFFHDRILLSKDGPLKIEKELLEKGIPVDASVTESLFSEDLELERIEKIVSKLVKKNKDGYRKFQQKTHYYLTQLGYHSHLIDIVLNRTELDDTDLYQKEYQKVFRQLSKKYSGQELEYKIRQKLYQKGFRN